MRSNIFRISAGLAIIILITWFLLPKYMQKALIYQKPGIRDLEIFENRMVKAGKPMAWPVDSLCNAEPISDSASAEFKKYETVAYLVVKGGRIVHEEYWDGWNDSTVSNSFSMAKSIVSLLIGCLIEEKKVALDDPVRKYIPELLDMKDHPVLIRHLLTMSSGLNWDESYSSLTSVTTEAYYGNDIQGLVTSLNPTEVPGKIHRYKSCDTQLLGIIVERASGMKVADYASLRLWQPLGAEFSAYWSLDSKDGNEKVYCCFNATARDFARIGQMVLDSGMFNGRQVVPKDYISEATSPATCLKDDEGKPCDYYGYQFWLTTYKGQRVIFARGILGQYIFIIPALNTVIVRLGHKRSDEYTHHTPMDAFTYIDEGIRLATPK